MTTLLTIGLTNAMVATLLAIVVWSVTRVWRHPPFVQLMWVLVLVKLVTPPLVAIPWHFERRPVSDPDATQTMLAAAEQPTLAAPLVQTTAKTSTTRTTATAPHDTNVPAQPPALVGNVDRQLAFDPVDQTAILRRMPPDWVTLIATAWLAGSAVWLLIALVRLARFHSAMQHTVACNDDVHRLADEVAAKLGVTGQFRLRLTDARLSPLVWPIGRPTILLSRSLLADLSREEVQTLLAHELAHLRRKDHWLRWFELFVTAAYWWHPVVWWARRMIQRAEEQSCDAWVVFAFPDAAKRYASALFKAVQMVSERRSIAPIIASRLGSTGNLKERIEDIMNATWNCRLGLPARVLVMLVALVILPFSLRAVTAADEQAADAISKKTTVVDEQQPAGATKQERYNWQTASKKLTDREKPGAAQPEKLRAGMHVAIQVVGLPADAPILGDYVVEPSGTVALGPIYGRVRIEGMTLLEAEAALKKQIDVYAKNAFVQITIPQSSPARNRVRVPNDPYRIAPGDVLLVTVANALVNQPIADDFLVEPSGSIALGPAYGRAKVAGLTLEEADRAVAKHLEDILEEPEVQVTLGGWKNKFGGLERDSSKSVPANESSPSVSVWKKIVESKKHEYERMKALANGAAASAAEVEKARLDYDIAVAQLEHRQRTLKYAQLEVQLAETELQEAASRRRTTGASIDNGFELKKLQIKVEMAKVKVSELE